MSFYFTVQYMYSYRTACACACALECVLQHRLESEDAFEEERKQLLERTGALEMSVRALELKAKSANDRGASTTASSSSSSS